MNKTKANLKMYFSIILPKFYKLPINIKKPNNPKIIGLK